MNRTVVKLYKVRDLCFALIQMEGEEEVMDILELAGVYRRARHVVNLYGIVKLNNAQWHDEVELRNLHQVLVRPSAKNLTFRQLEALLRYLMPERHSYEVERYSKLQDEEMLTGLRVLALVLRQEAQKE